MHQVWSTHCSKQQSLRSVCLCGWWVWNVHLDMFVLDVTHRNEQIKRKTLPWGRNRLQTRLNDHEHRVQTTNHTLYLKWICMYNISSIMCPFPLNRITSFLLLHISIIPLFLHLFPLFFSFWHPLVVCLWKREREREWGVERPAKLEQSSPWWYFYPGQQAPPGIYITHTHISSCSPLIAFSPIQFGFILDLPASLFIFRSVFLTDASAASSSSCREEGARPLVSLQLETLAVWLLCCWADLSCFGLYCICVCAWCWKLGICWHRSVPPTEQAVL